MRNDKPGSFHAAMSKNYKKFIEPNAGNVPNMQSGLSKSGSEGFFLKP
jgi:hypothetical protein